MTTPTPLGDHMHYIGAKIGLFSKIATQEHVKIYNRRELESLLTRHGLMVVHHETFEFGMNQLVVATPSYAE